MHCAHFVVSFAKKLRTTHLFPLIPQLHIIELVYNMKSLENTLWFVAVM